MNCYKSLSLCFLSLVLITWIVNHEIQPITNSFDPLQLPKRDMNLTQEITLVEYFPSDIRDD